MSTRDRGSRPVGAVKRPEAAEARRLRAAELLAQGRSKAEVAETVGVSRARAALAGPARPGRGGGAAPPPGWGRPPKLSDTQADQVEQVLRQGALANGFASDL